MRKLILILFSVFLLNISYGQDQLKLAMEYYNSGEYDKSAVLFEKLYKQRKAKYYFDYYLQSLIKAGQYDKAQHAVEKQIRKNKGNLAFMVDLGYIYKLRGNTDKAERIFKDVLKKLPDDKNSIYQIARSFINYKLYEWAEKVYIKGRTLTGYGFYPELASVYAMQRNSAKMINAYLDWLLENPAYLGTVEHVFASYIRNDVNDEFYNTLLGELLRKVQKTSNRTLTELLIWTYEKKGNLDMALIYAKALDRRYDEGGARVYRLGMLALQDGKLDIASEAFDYVISLQYGSPYYYKARKAQLEVLYRQVVSQNVFEKTQIEQLVDKYEKLLNEIGYGQEATDLVIRLATLKAFYLNQPDNALVYLDKLLQNKTLDNKVKGQLLMLKAKIELSQNKPWDAILLYSQAYDINKTNEVGDQAKLDRALVYYFMGDFTWAKSQFDILKGSTYKLIANDAIEKANLLEEFAQDSTMKKSLELYAKAEYYFFVNRTDSALVLLDSLSSAYVTLADYALMLKYRIYYSVGRFKQAAAALETLVKNYNQSVLIDRAVFFLGMLYQDKLGDNEKAKEYFKKILFDYKGSIFTEEARERYRQLSGE